MTPPTRLERLVNNLHFDLNQQNVSAVEVLKLLRREQLRTTRLVVLQKKHYELQLDTEVVEGSERSFEQVSCKIEACNDLLAALRKGAR